MKRWGKQVVRPESKKRIKIIAVIGVIVIGFVLLGWVLYFPLFVQLPNLNNEYRTAAVIADVQKFFENHDGQWPKSWSDFGSGQDLREHTIVRFDLTSKVILDNPALIHEAIQPVTGQYYTYPHARRQLELLLETIKEHSAPDVPSKRAQPEHSGISSD